ncbi:MAG: peptide deformylase [Bacteroidales bacterium]
MVMPVHVYGMSVLRKVAREVPEDYENLDGLIADMFETMYASEGVGLAAPQVGKSLRLIVMDGSPMAENNPQEPELATFRKVLINPILLEETGDSWTFEEGCLSLPNLREEVSRPEKVRLEYYNENWELVEEVYDGIRARIIQHEYDHLEGRLFVDRINPIRRKLLSARLHAISRGKADCEYKIVYKVIK